MPKRLDIKKILVIGAGPIVIGQGCEFDYSGSQACRALKEEGYEVVLINPNPASIMTDRDIATATYLEPINSSSVKSIIEHERPQALLPTMGGQTALNCTRELHKKGILRKYSVELIGACMQAIDNAENRAKFSSLMQAAKLPMARSGIANDIDTALQIQKQMGFPTIIRPSYTLGGTGGGIAYNLSEFMAICQRGLRESPTNELLIEESLIGWKEFELEVIRDSNDNCIVVCGIENLDPMGIHTGDSITVAPIQTLADKEYNLMRQAAFTILRTVGVKSGGANVQFAVNPTNGRMVVIEMNPRVSRSSALASKATGFPIAKVAAKLAVGYSLDELRNDITQGVIPASFEPALDYVVVKIPCFAFDKFPSLDGRLTTQMQSIGEAMAIGTSFISALQKAIVSIDSGHTGLESIDASVESLLFKLKLPTPDRLFVIADAIRAGIDKGKIALITGVDPWFIEQISMICLIESEIAAATLATLTADKIRAWKIAGFTDARIGQLLKCSAHKIKSLRNKFAVVASYRRVDSCAAEFKAETNYLYSSYFPHKEVIPESSPKVMILGSGPNKIGQGIEFDYCCVKASQALQELGYKTIMVNCNPETVSTDYDVSDMLYFEPLNLESVLEIYELEQPIGVVLQYGGQTPLRIATELAAYGIKILGTQPEAIFAAENRLQFSSFIDKLGLKQPDNYIIEQPNTIDAIPHLSLPVIARPSNVLGGKNMQILYSQAELQNYLMQQQEASCYPILLETFLQDAVEIDVDGVAGRDGVLICGIMQHVESAGIHSGDSSSVMPPFSISKNLENELIRQAKLITTKLLVKGIFNIQFALHKDQIFVLEVNPRAARTVPFVSKAAGIPVAKLGIHAMLDKPIMSSQNSIPEGMFAVKHPIFPFHKLQVAQMLGPQMFSTGEVMAMGEDLYDAYFKAASNVPGALSYGGNVCMLFTKQDVRLATELARAFVKQNHCVYSSTEGANLLRQSGILCENLAITADVEVLTSWLLEHKIKFVFATIAVEFADVLRSASLQAGVTMVSDWRVALLFARGLERKNEFKFYKLQELHQERGEIIT